MDQLIINGEDIQFYRADNISKDTSVSCFLSGKKFKYLTFSFLSDRFCMICYILQDSNDKLEENIAKGFY